MAGTATAATVTYPVEQPEFPVRDNEIPKENNKNHSTIWDYICCIKGSSLALGSRHM